MNAKDTGYFQYDDRYPPLCVTAVTHVDERMIDTQITDYLQESYRSGIKHVDTILSSGLSAGEAGVIYIRKLNNKRRRNGQTVVDVNSVRKHVAESLYRHMGIDVYSSVYIDTFQRHVSKEIFQTNQYRRKLMQAIKQFLKDVNLKTKGYTAKLRNVMTTVNAQLSSLDNN